jgi:hypothetical protein
MLNAPAANFWMIVFCATYSDPEVHAAFRATSACPDAGEPSGFRIVCATVVGEGPFSENHCVIHEGTAWVPTTTEATVTGVVLVGTDQVCTQVAPPANTHDAVYLVAPQVSFGTRCAVNAPFENATGTVVLPT